MNQPIGSAGRQANRYQLIAKKYWPHLFIFLGLVIFYLKPFGNTFVPVVGIFAMCLGALAMGRRRRTSR